MIALYIIGGIALLFLLLGQLRVRIYAAFYDEVRVFAKVGFIKIQLLPAPRKKPKKEKQPAPMKAKSAKPKEIGQKLTLEEIKSLIAAIGKGLRQMARKARNRMRIDPLEVSVVTGGDPFDAARYYGYLNQAVFTGMPLLESVFHIPDPRIHLDMDGSAEKTKVHGKVGFYLRICDGVAIAMVLLKPLLRWFLAWKKKPASADSRTQAPTNTEETKIA